ncbi:WD40 repeat domain-containing protein [Kitasatospora sp. NPDC058965]|uniref:WD40 repeat domain-containing protein n=1 Tax=Kitasatospora sp. NPDC058965 TaxID=3346682 RepID=UPI0036CAAC6F
MAVGSDQGGLVVWDVDGGGVRELAGHRGEAVQSLAWTPDGRLCSGGSAGTVRVWSSESGALLSELSVGDPAEPYGRAVRGLAVHPDGRQLAAGTHSGSVRLWDLAAGAPGPVLRPGGEWVAAGAFSPQGDLLAVAGRSAAQTWRLPSGDSAGAWTVGSDFQLAVAVRPDGRQIATAGQDRLVRLWNARTGAPERSLSGLNGWVSAVQYSPDGRQVVACDGDGAVARWSVDTGALLVHRRRLLPVPAVRRPGEPKPAWEAVAEQADWSTLRCGCPRGARHVPGSFARLMAATTDDEADGKGLDRDVTRDGFLFEAAVPVTEMVVAALLQDGAPAPVRRRLLRLLSSLVGGESESAEAEQGRPDLGDACREAARPAVPLLRAELAHESFPGAAVLAAEALDELE